MSRARVYCFTCFPSLSSLPRIRSPPRFLSSSPRSVFASELNTYHSLGSLHLLILLTGRRAGVPQVPWPQPRAVPYPYLAHWHWHLRPALAGVEKADLNDRFCAHFLLSIEDGNHDVPGHLALFVHKRSDFPVELDDIGLVIGEPLIYGYVQFRTCWLCSVLEWLMSMADPVPKRSPMFQS